ncbi:MAG: carboxypeptidase-like regulatory domain-containing protein [Salinivirgaceae bacterium]|nr:carboxypeptidase-like regulatory domain-containing protein [Salinivirgaceae bacterium]MDD4745643.1 carboxypeptidase-like regulatory domain-containing protein [Salinivirgaceae bacterium]
MNRVFCTLFLLLPLFVNGQQSITGRVFDKESRTELLYATIQLQHSSRGTVSDDKGRFRLVVPKNSKSDTVIVSFIGYRNEKISIKDMEKDATVFLTPIAFNIREFTVVAQTKEYILKLLNKIIRSYRRSNENDRCKSLLSVISYNDSIPVEVVEAFYNSSISKCNGFDALELKMGRYGHAKDLQFYSMNTTDLLKTYNLFSIDSYHKLPLWPGKMTRNAIKKNYSVEMLPMHNDSLVKIVFATSDRKLFDGHIIFNKYDQDIVEIDLHSANPTLKGIAPIDETHKMNVDSMAIRYKYNTLNRNRLEFVVFSYALDYQISSTNYKINTNCNIQFYDYDNLFMSPIYTSNPFLLNDYERIIGNGFDLQFWNYNYNLPFESTISKLFQHFQNIGYTINFNSQFPIDFNTHFSFPLLKWEKKNRIRWNCFNVNLKPGKKKHDIETITKVTYSDMYKADIGLFFNPLTIGSSIDTVLSYAYFNMRTSYFYSKLIGRPLTLFNIIFDYYSLKELQLKPTLKSIPLSDFANRIAKVKQDCKVFEKEIVSNTGLGKDTLRLKEYNDRFKEQTGIDYYLISEGSDSGEKKDDISKSDPKYYLAIATNLFEKKDYENALVFFEKAESMAEDPHVVIQINYNRAVLYIALGEYSKAILDLKKNGSLGDAPSIELLKTISGNDK